MCATSLLNAVSAASMPSASTSSSGPISIASASYRPSSASSMPGVSNGTARAARHVPDQRLTRRAVAQIEAMRSDEIGRRRALRQERNVEPLARKRMQQHVHQREQKCGVGLRLDRHPFGRARARHRQVRLDLHALHAADARVRVAPHADDAARRLDVGAARDQVLGERRVRRHGERAVPELAVEMLRVVALDALAGAEAHVDRAPRREKRGERPHVRLRRAGAAQADGETRITRLVGEARGADAR